MITHSIESYWIPSQKKTKSKLQIKRICQNFKFFEFWNKHWMRYTFWNSLIRCANMKWILQVLLKIESGHDSVHRRTDRQGETSIPPFNFIETGGGGIIKVPETPCLSFCQSTTQVCNSTTFHHLFMHLPYSLMKSISISFKFQQCHL